jgi:hypothetical protein
MALADSLKPTAALASMTAANRYFIWSSFSSLGASFLGGAGSRGAGHLRRTMNQKTRFDMLIFQHIDMSRPKPANHDLNAA